MQTQVFRTFAVSAALTGVMFAQNASRQAAMVGGGAPDRGKCTIEVVVDDAAQVEIRGATGTIHNQAGQPAQWRRFECTGPLPANPANFRFAGVDGRGRQELVRDPRNGGVAVVQIEDKQGGSEGYTFDLFWDPRGANGYPNPGAVNGAPPPPNYQDRGQRGPDSQNGPPDRGYRDGEQYRPNYRDSDYYRRYGHGFGIDEAIRVCQQAVFTQAVQRFRTQDIHFYRAAVDDNPGREDWVTGTLDLHRGGREEEHRYSCSMDFNSGRLRSAQLDGGPSDGRDRR